MKNNYNYSKEKNVYFNNDLKYEKRLRKKINDNLINNNQNKSSFLLDINDNNNYNYDQNDVIMPKWAQNNPYIFISKMKNFLESEEVEKNIFNGLI